MKGRDLLILAAVTLVGGFAVADALRDDGSSDALTEESTASTEATPESDLGRAQLRRIPGTAGSLVLVETGACAVREFELPSGRELPNVVSRSSCDVWAAPQGSHAAVGVAQAVGDAVPFRFVDLARPGRELGTSEAWFGSLVWSADGSRAAWCNRRRVAVELELGVGRRVLAECPAAYTPDGEVVYARGDRLVVEDRPGPRASGRITGVHFGSRGSLGLVIEGRRLERRADEQPAFARDLPERLHGRLPTWAPDGCAALFRDRDRMILLDVGCSGFEEQAFPGHTAAWSPDGRWLAVGGAVDVTIHDLQTGSAVTWSVGAVDLAWRRGP